MHETAEVLLQHLQHALSEASGALPSDRAVLRNLERAYGAEATRAGRRLHDLVAGSPAWELLEKPGRSRLPRLHDLCDCAPLLQAMRESGELAQREALLKERDRALAAVWRQEAATDEERWLGAESVQDEYFAGVQRLTEAYRAGYAALRRASSGRAAPLAGPRVRSRLFLQPPLMALLFRACHQAGSDLSQGGNTLQLRPDDAATLDALAWDIAALAVSAFFARTDAAQSDASFPFFLDDYFQWRGVDPRKRSPEMRRKVVARLEFLCSDRMPIRSQASLWRTSSETGQRKKVLVSAEGPFLVKHARLFRPPPASGGAEPEPIGYLLSLGQWAAPFVAERAMRGIHLKRLAEYDLQRQPWERRIGWYLVFQMNNQASKMTFQESVKDGKSRIQVTPQHPLKMKTVLEGSAVAWEEMARTNPGKVIKQWGDALETLRKDGILGSCPCLDGPSDGSDLPTRGRLAAMLERRYQFVPGKELLPHLHAKCSAAARKQGQ